MLVIISLLLSLFSVFRFGGQLIIYWASNSVVLLFLSIKFYQIDIYLQFFIFNFILFSFVVSYFFKNKMPVEYFSNHVDSREGVIYLRLGVLLGILAVILYVVGGGGITGIARSWVDIAVSRNLAQLMLTNASQYLYLTAIVFFTVSWCASKSLKPLIFMVTIGFVYMALTRVKANLLPLILPHFIILVIIYRSKPVKMFIFGLVFSCFIAFSYLLVTLIRWMGGEDNWSQDKFLEVFDAVLDKGLERNLFFQSSSIFEYYLENDLLWGQTYISFLNPILRFVNSSVENPMYIYSSILYGAASEMKGSAHPTLFVDSFANFGVFGFLCGFIWIVFLHLFSILSLKIGRYGLICFLVSTSYGIPLICRGSVYYGFQYMVVSAMFMFVLLSFFSIFLKTRWKS